MGTKVDLEALAAHEDDITAAEEQTSAARRKTLLYTGLATVTSIGAINGLYQSTKAHQQRKRQLREGELSKNEAAELQKEHRKRDLISLGLVAVSCYNTRLGWQRMKGKHVEEQKDYSAEGSPEAERFSNENYVKIMALRLALSPIYVTPLRHSLRHSLTSQLYSSPTLYTQHAPRILSLGFLPSIAIRLGALPTFLSDLWESLLRAVPKKKTSHRKKRQRFLAGKALKDVTSLNKCSACGNVKRAHLLCPYCVQEIHDMWKTRGEEDVEGETIRDESRAELSKAEAKTHITDIFSLAVTPHQIISASGSSDIKIYSTNEPDFPLTQTLDAAHKLGVHHLAASRDGHRLASAGFAGDVKLWRYEEGQWAKNGEIVDGNKAGEIWAIAISAEGQYLAATSVDGRINVWDNFGGYRKIREFETKGSFGMAIDLSPDGRYTASGHENGGVYIFNNDTGRLLHSLPGLIKAVRAVAFSPAGKLLAAAGDARVIALYDVAAGEQVANLTGHGAWIFSLDWSDTGEFLLSGYGRLSDGNALLRTQRRIRRYGVSNGCQKLEGMKDLRLLGLTGAYPSTEKRQEDEGQCSSNGKGSSYPKKHRAFFTMFAKSTLLAAAFAASAQLVAAAVPPGCLIAAFNTQPVPGNLPLICGSDAGKVQTQIRAACNTAEYEKAALSAFKEICGSIGKTVSSSADSSSSKTSSSASSSESRTDSSSTSESSSDTTTSAGSSGSTTAPYPIVYTSTFYDNECSCTKTTAVSSSGIAGSTGFATGTGAPAPTGIGSPSGGAGSGSGATGSPITPVPPKGTGNAGGNAPFTGAASKTVGSFAAAALAVFGLALAL
ncbi:MAG: hypothetical protein Q9213_003406 [Squamulea squamosa]